MLKALCQSLCLVLPLVANAQPASVVFLNPGLSTETFWTSYTRFMQAAADELGMTLQVQYSERRADLALAQARAILSAPQRPDYLVLVNEQYVAPEILRLSRGTGVKLLLVNNGLTASQRLSIEAQPGKYAEPLGTLMSNDEKAGFQMLHLMLAQLPRDAGPVDLVAFAGVKTTPASQLRVEGMRRALADFPQVRLRQVVYGGWNRQRAYEQAQQLLERYPATRLVWSANDQMAFGAMQAFEEAGYTPGRDVLFGAVNSSAEALRARIDGRLSVLMGGHFTLGGWAMVMLHDYHAGIDFAERGGKNRVDQLFSLLDAGQAARLQQRIRRKGYGLDFRQFSALYRPQLKDYGFSSQALLE